MTERSGRSGEGPESAEELAQRVLRRFESFRRFVVVCAECQAEMSADWHYCTDCGARLATECPACQQPLPPYGARFCPHCGLLIPRVAAKEESPGAPAKEA